MKRFKTVLCLILAVICVFSVTAFAANSFEFNLVTTGVDYSAAAKKANDKSFASVDVLKANNYAYRYAVATGIRTDYVTGWKEVVGKDSFDLNYYSKPSRNTSLRLHGSTSSASGTSTIQGTWIP